MFNFHLIQLNHQIKPEWLLEVTTKEELTAWYCRFATGADIWVDLKANYIAQDFTYIVSPLIFKVLKSSEGKFDFVKVAKLYEDINYIFKLKVLQKNQNLLINSQGGFSTKPLDLVVVKSYNSNILDFPKE